MKKQQGTCTTCFSGHNLSRKGKTQNKKAKTIQNPKKLKASHFAVETVGISIGVSWLSQGEGKRDPRASLQAASGRTTKRKEKRVAGAQTSASSEKGMGGGGVFQTFSAVENTEKQKLITTCGLLKPQNYVSKMCSGASKILVTSFISLFISKLSLKRSTQRKKAWKRTGCVFTRIQTPHGMC